MPVKNTKARYFAFILYPDSMPQDCWERLERLGLAMAISPLHDHDKSTVVGQTYKKPHYHVLYVARNPVTVESVRNKIKRALGNKTISHIEIVDNVAYYYQYLTHESKDAIAKNKYKYDKRKIVYLNDFDVDRYVTLDDAQKKDIMNTLLRAVLAHRIANIFDLNDFILAHGVEIGVKNIDVANEVIKSNTGLFRLYFDGAYQRNKTEATARMQPKRRKVDVETGEIIDK